MSQRIRIVSIVSGSVGSGRLGQCGGIVKGAAQRYESGVTDARVAVTYFG